MFENQAQHITSSFLRRVLLSFWLVICPSFLFAQQKAGSELEMAKSDPRVQERLRQEGRRQQLFESLIDAAQQDPSENGAIALSDFVEGVADHFGVNSKARLIREAEQEAENRRAIEIYREIREQEREKDLQREIDYKLNDILSDSLSRSERAFRNMPEILENGAAQRANEQLQLTSRQIQQRSEQTMQENFQTSMTNLQNNVNSQLGRGQTSATSNIQRDYQMEASCRKYVGTDRMTGPACLKYIRRDHRGIWIWQGP